MNRNKKNLHKVAANVLGVTLASALVTGAVAETAAPIPVFAAQQEAQTQEKIIYLNGSIQAGENADGTGQAQAVDSFEKAFALAGGQGTVMVCGTVNVSTEKKLHIPAGVKIKRNAGFTGALVKVTGKGKLTVTGDGITAQDVDVSTAESGKGAFVAAKIPQVVIPAQITLNNLMRAYGAATVYGSDIALSVYGMMMKVYQIAHSMFVGVSSAIQPINGYNFGANHYARVQKTFHIASLIAVGISVVWFLIFMVFPRQIASCFVSDNALYLDCAQHCFRLYMLAFFLYGLHMTSASFFQGIGRPGKSLLIPLARQGCFLIPLALLLSRSFGLDGALLAAPIADALAFLLCLLLARWEFRSWRRKGWLCKGERKYRAS